MAVRSAVRALQFCDHASFQRAAVGMVLGSAVLGLAHHPLTPLAPLIGGLFGIAVGTAFGYGRAPRRLAAACAATVVLVALTPSWSLLAGVAALAALGSAAGIRRGLGGIAATVAIAAITLAAMWAALRVVEARATAAWPGWARDLAAALAMGMVGVLTTLPRHLRIRADAVAAAARRLPAPLPAELRALCDRALAIWATFQARADGDPDKQLAHDGTLATLELAADCARQVPTGSDDELVARLAALDARIAAATDPEVSGPYRSARGLVDDQRAYRARIHQHHERLLARVHGQVAALEKLELAGRGGAPAASPQ